MENYPMGGSFNHDPQKPNGLGSAPNTTPDAADPSVNSREQTRDGNVNTVRELLSNPAIPTEVNQQYPQGTWETQDKKPEAKNKKLRLRKALLALGAIAATTVVLSIGARADSAADETAHLEPGTSSTQEESNPNPESTTEQKELTPSEKPDLLERLEEDRQSLEAFNDEEAHSFEVFNESFVKPLNLALTLAYDNEYASDPDKLDSEASRILELSSARSNAKFWKSWLYDQWAADEKLSRLGDSDFIRQIAVNQEDSGEEAYYDLFSARYAEGAVLRSFVQEFPEGGVPGSYDGKSQVVDTITTYTFPKVYMESESYVDNVWNIDSFGLGGKSAIPSEQYTIDPLENPVETPLFSE